MDKNERLIYLARTVAGRFEIVQNVNNHLYHARMVGKNGKTLWWCEQYKRLQGVLRGLRAFQSIGLAAAETIAKSMGLKI
jgi:uncharacterized protein YegP (UPF0339 family)